ncbi:MAG: RnfABCDGE type electron transport complex subunit B [Candidatus Krumholzibacteriota bacterium]|nr:RnfABCDGE type electron transport complex subunit B [Candidatus Krumholzibacteriota bacterium]
MLTAILALAAVALALSFVLAIAARVFAVDVDPRAEKIEEALPGANCGACGLPGCSELARRIAEGKADIDACPVGGAAVARAIAAIMGQDFAGGGVRRVAMVMCNGGDESARRRFWYNGVRDCNSAALLFGGDKSCAYGCLGLGTCAGVCPFGAIDMTGAGLAVVDPARCTGCTKCVDACPKGIIRMVPADRTIHILCSSHDKGAKTRKVCAVGCIGCMKCVKAAPEGAIAMDRNLAVVDYEAEIPPEIAGECPMKTIHVRKLDGLADLDAAAGGER